MSEPQNKKASETLTASEQESAKTARQKREDIAYTVNHTLVCGSKDVVEPFIMAGIQTLLGKKIVEADRPGFGKSVRNWFIGEAAGDAGAVPVTIAFQRHAPELMASLGNRLESVFGGHFRKGAEEAARDWAKEHGVAADDPRIKEKAEELYRYEMQHLPQAAIWTVSSIGLNVATQKILPVLSHGKIGSSVGLGELLAIKTLGGGITAGLLFTARSSSPRMARKWDRWVSEHLFAPAEHFVHETLGTDIPAQAPNWQERVSADTAQDGQQQRRS